MGLSLPQNSPPEAPTGRRLRRSFSEGGPSSPRS
jgi:hypothetical protein